MPRIYLKFKDFTAIPIFTETLNIPTGNQAIVYDLIMAAVSEPTRSLLGLPVDFGPLSLHLPDGFNRSDLPEDCFLNETSTSLDPGCLLSTLYSLEINSKRPLILKLQSSIQSFLLNILGNIEKDLPKVKSTVAKRSGFKNPKSVILWKYFKTEAINFDYPTEPIPSDVILPPTSNLIIKSELDVDNVIRNHFQNFNRIFGNACQFDSNSGTTNGFKGIPDNVITIDSKIVSFIEDKTPNTLPGKGYNLFNMYQEDYEHMNSNVTRSNIGRTDVLSLIAQIYGYIALNNLIYGCVTCYDVTYFLRRSKKGRLEISDPIYNNSESPTLLQSFYYFTQLVIAHHQNQELEPSSAESSDKPPKIFENEDEESNFNEQSDSGSNYSSTDNIKSTAYNKNPKKKFKHSFSEDSIRNGKVVGTGATGQVILLEKENIVLKQCDSYNNPEGFKMLKTEISIYNRLSKYNLDFIPEYYGTFELYGQHFIALKYIKGQHCEWKDNAELKMQIIGFLKELKKFGVIHQDLRKENVLLTPERKLFLIDFGMASIEDISREC